MAKFTVYYYNNSPFGLLSALGTGDGEVTLYRDDFTIVAREVESPTLDTLFRSMNAVDGDELCCQLKVRSMSTGDVAEEEDGTLHQCAVIGWKLAIWEMR